MSSTAFAPTLVRTPTAVREAALALAGVLLVALAAQIVIPLPFTPVPITGQTFAALLVGGAYGAGRGATTLGLYLVVGCLGAPVFADGAHGTTCLSYSHLRAHETDSYLVCRLLLEK